MQIFSVVDRRVEVRILRHYTAKETSFYIRRLCWNRSNVCFPCIVDY